MGYSYRLANIIEPGLQFDYQMSSLMQTQENLWIWMLELFKEEYYTDPHRSQDKVQVSDW